MKFNVGDMVQTVLPGPVMCVCAWSKDAALSEYKCFWWRDSEYEERWFREDLLLAAPPEKGIGFSHESP